MKKLIQAPAAIWYLALLLLLLSVCKRVSSTAMDSLKSSELDDAVVISRLEETEMDSEINRRLLLMRKSYISYETLRRDMTPCERPGASYYNCRSTGVANPYTRGCEMIVGCARNIRDIND